MITDKIIDKVAGSLRIENAVEDGADGLVLVTSCFIGQRSTPVYTHRLPLDSLLSAIEVRYDLTPAETMEGRVKVSKIGIPQEDTPHHPV
jgi:hypothetical protein